MGRESTNASYRELCAELERRSPEANLGADIIVGFPGETERDYEETVRLLEESPLAYAHVFLFRPPRDQSRGTAGRGSGDGQIPGRLAAPPVRKKNLAYRRRLIGRTLPGVVIQSKPGGLRS